MDGEVACLAALVISANHRIARPDDPMMWFSTQRAFARCGEISFHAATKSASGELARIPVADTPETWLDQLAASGVQRVVLGFERRDEDLIEGETLPDRIAAGFAGGGSRWVMTTEAGDGTALAWRANWRAAFPDAEDGRIWAVRHTAAAAEPQPIGRPVAAARTELRHALAEMSEFAWEHEAKRANRMFTSALGLLDGGTDTMRYDRRVGPADTLPDGARRLLNAAQRGWVFDNMGIWDRIEAEHAEHLVFARASESLYDAVTAAIVAAVNASVSIR